MTPHAIRQLRIDLDAFAPADDAEAAHRRRMLDLLRVGPLAFDRSHFEPGHFTASAFVLSPGGSSLLLIHHAKLGRWLQPGGHVDATDATPLDAARRELLEEAGVADATLIGGLFDVDVHPIPPNPKRGEPGHEHFDLRYLFRADREDVVAASDALAARWATMDEAARVDDASVRRAAAKLTRAVRRPNNCVVE